MIGHFRHLIQIDTSNPPGNEIEAARYIEGVLCQEGIECQVLEPFPGRGSVIGRIRGNGSARPLLLMAHLDVVPADTEKWQHPPFGAELVENYIWGRGALDCKNTVALWLQAMLAVKRSGMVPSRDLIFMASADEEAGGKAGLGWIVENAYHLIDAEAALNEGGGIGIKLLGKTFFAHQNAEKGNLWLRITAQGETGHGSVPRAKNAVVLLMDGLRRLMQHKTSPRMTSTTRAMIEAIAASQPFYASWLLQLLKNPRLASKLLPVAIRDETLAGLVSALLHNTVSPTVLAAGNKVNVIPSEASAEVDIRILPGEEAEQYLAEVKSVLGPDITVEVLDLKSASESPVDHPLVGSMTRAIRQLRPTSSVIPMMLPAVTDGAYLRRRGMAVYGFTPLLPDEHIGLIHGNDERISLGSLRFGLEVGLRAILDFVR